MCGQGTEKALAGKKGRCRWLSMPKEFTNVNQKLGQELSQWDSTRVILHPPQCMETSPVVTTGCTPGLVARDTAYHPMCPGEPPTEMIRPQCPWPCNKTRLS